MNILSILTGEEGDVGKSMTPQVGRTSLEFSLLSYEQDDDQDIQRFSAYLELLMCVPTSK
ncbi:unnamed protein product [Brassica rapa subsp. trilocularis]